MIVLPGGQNPLRGRGLHYDVTGCRWHGRLALFTRSANGSRKSPWPGSVLGPSCEQVLCGVAWPVTRVCHGGGLHRAAALKPES